MNGQDFYLGKFSDSWFPLHGVLDELRIYNRVLSNAEIATLAGAYGTALIPQTVIEKLYIAYFGRPTHPSGLAYWTDELASSNGSSATLQNMFTSFYLSAEYKILHAGQTTEELVNSLFQYMFGRNAVPAGLNFWGQQIDSGEITLDKAAYAILTGASPQDLAVLNNKALTATTFTAHIDTPRRNCRL